MPRAAAEFLCQAAADLGTDQGQTRSARASCTDRTRGAGQPGRTRASCAGTVRYTRAASGRAAGDRAPGDRAPGLRTSGERAGSTARALRRGAGATRLGAVTGRLLEFSLPVIGASQPGLQR